jgi:hypothetical protein
VTDAPERRRPRWDPDERGIGVGDARAHLEHIDRLREAAATPGWVAEDPGSHLGPHLERAVAAGSSWVITGMTTAPDGTFVVDLRWAGPAVPDRRTVRAAAYELIGSVAEASSVVHERGGPDGASFDAVTGTLDGDSSFAAHGHTLRLRTTVG